MSAASASPSPPSSNAPTSSERGSLGIIGGSSFLDSQLLSDFELIRVSTVHGDVQLRANKGRDIFFVQRHGASVEHAYSPPHLINYRAITLALQSVGVSQVIGFGSVGSLHRTIPVHTLLIPDDFYCPHQTITLSHFDKSGHVVPKFDAALASKCKTLLAENGISFVGSGVYAQTIGPRFETRAEIRALANYAHVVGMTCAHESSLFRELSIPYALICMVDNYANGVLDVSLTTHDFHEGVRQNLATMEKILGLVMTTMAPTASASLIASSLPSHPSTSSPSPSTSAPSIPSSSSSSAEGRKLVDLVVHARFVIPIEPAGVLEDHSLVVNDGVIVDVLPTVLARDAYLGRTVRELSSAHAVMPGFINAHTHAGMTLLRGYSDDVCLSDWLNNHIWPAEGVFCSPSFTRDSTELALAEMIRSGTTTINEMYFFPQQTLEVVETVGIRANIGLVSLDFPTKYASSFDDYLTKNQQVRASFEEKIRSNPQLKNRVTFSFTPHAPYTVSDAHFEKIRDEAAKVHEGICTHLHETRAEVVDSSTSTTPSPSRHLSTTLSRPLHNLNRLGVVNNRFLAVHMTQVNDDDLAILKSTKSSVVHCPSSNLKLASGFCPISKLVAAGVTVALGTDSSASNNSLDMFNEMRVASLLAKGLSEDATSIPAATALRMATLNGAIALGIDAHTGSLQRGKQADFIAISLADIDMQPLYQIQSHLVYAASRDRVTDTWVAGKALMIDRQLTTLDTQNILSKCKTWTAALMKHKADHLCTIEHNQNKNKRKVSAGENDDDVASKRL